MESPAMGAMGSTVRWYNSARRIPMLVGKLPSGEQIWGGPYRASQAVAACVVTVLAFATRGLWGPLIAGPGLLGMVTTLVACVVAGVVAGWAAGRLPMGSDPVLEARVVLGQGLRAPSATWGRTSLKVGGSYRLRTSARILHLTEQGHPVGIAIAPVEVDMAEIREPRPGRPEVAGATAPASAARVPLPTSTPAQKLAALMESR